MTRSVAACWLAGRQFLASRSRALRHGLILAGLLFAAYLFAIAAPKMGSVGADAFAYWSVDPSDPYRLAEGVTGAFAYPPPSVAVFAIAAALSWPAFWFLWMAALVATLLWLGWRRALVILAFPPVAIELYFGNINLLLAAAIALGFRYPAAWAFVILTKVTPGVGLVWFLMRREWRSLAVALGVTGVLAAPTLVLDGQLWGAWVSSVLRRVEHLPGGFVPIPFVVRFPAAIVLVAWGARTDRRWTVPVAATMALPAVWLGGLAILAALPALDRPELQSSSRVPAA